MQGKGGDAFENVCKLHPKNQPPVKQELGRGETLSKQKDLVPLKTHQATSKDGTDLKPSITKDGTDLKPSHHEGWNRSKTNPSRRMEQTCHLKEWISITTKPSRRMGQAVSKHYQGIKQPLNYKFRPCDCKNSATLAQGWQNKTIPNPNRSQQYHRHVSATDRQSRLVQHARSPKQSNNNMSHQKFQKRTPPSGPNLNLRSCIGGILRRTGTITPANILRTGSFLHNALCRFPS